MALPAPSSDRTAIVTGASSGIGTELARELARRGHGVTLVARREDRLRTIAEELAKEHEVRTEVVTADLTDEASRTNIAREVTQRGLTAEQTSNALPKFMWLSAHDVAKTAIDGLDKGRAVVIPGAANRVGAVVAHLTPRRLLLPLLARQHPALKT